MPVQNDPAGPLLIGVQPQLRARNATEAISELSELFRGRATGLDVDAFRNAALLRESQAPTSLPAGLALPHARLQDVARIILAFGRVSPGLGWDGNTVRLVFLVAVPTLQHPAYLAFIQRLLRTLRSRPQMAELLDCDANTCGASLVRQLGIESVA